MTEDRDGHWDWALEEREVPVWDGEDPTRWTEPTDGERALEEWLAWHDPDYLEEIKAARMAGMEIRASAGLHRTIIPPWADPYYAEAPEHFGWNGDHQWARTIRPDERYL